MALSTIKNNTTHIQDLMSEIGINAKQAAKTIRTADTETKNKALLSAADFLEQDYKIILEANKIDVDNAKSKNLSASMIDRLILNEDKIKAIANALREIAALPDPVGRQLSQWERPNGLNITRISTPLGVIGIIYESRPNVTADAGALAMKSGNCSILRGGSESQLSSRAIHKCLIKGLEFANLPAEIIQLVPTTDREAVGMMLGGITDCIDMIIPRGGKSLVERIQKEAKVPVLAHLEGICHMYIHSDADEKMATDIAVNAKMRRTGVCGATETILIDKALDSQKIINILHALDQVGCTIKGCKKTVSFYSKVTLATEEDWRTEYLAPIVSVKIVDDFMHAINHIQTYSSGHTEAIITENNDLAEKFLLHIDSAITMHNASTQFADGGEFGMGAEIGIATGKIHARGPVGLEQLTCFKYQVRGNGQIRPL